MAGNSEKNERKPKILLIIPAFNEELNLAELVQSVKIKCPFADYLIVNDCSSDNTKELLEEMDYPHVNLPANLGIGGAVQTGYLSAVQNGYDIAIQVDGDGQHDVSYVKSLIDPIQTGKADMVIGSRFLTGEGFQSSRSRRLGIRLLSSLINFCTGVRVWDVTSGFRAVNRKVMELFAVNYPIDYPEPESIVAANVHGAKIQEIPVVMKERIKGVSSINWSKSIYYMIKVSIAIILCKMIGEESR